MKHKETDFDNIQRILRKLSRKQIEIVAEMVSDIRNSYRDADEARKKRFVKATSKLPMFADDETPDDEVMRGFHPLGTIKSTTQMERICGIGVGAGMAALSNHLDSIADKHGIDPLDDGDEWSGEDECY